MRRRAALSLRNVRRGWTLWEMLAVLVVLAIVAAIVVGQNGRSLLANFGSQSDARRLGLALLDARRRTISSGQTHGVVLNSSGGSINSFSEVSIVSGVTTVVDGPTPFTTGLTVTSSHTQMTFSFDGQAAAAYWVQLAGPSVTWRIDVVPITGALTTIKL
jgi:prepilin-type N-terminal cleavage/methylation domain-containing protein